MLSINVSCSNVSVNYAQVNLLSVANCYPTANG